MFDREILLNQFMLSYCDRLVADLSDDDFIRPAPGGGHSPQWILGHLTMVADYAGLMLGLKPVAAKSMREAFAPGKNETVQEGEEFARQSLTTAVRPAYQRLCNAACEAEEAEMKKLHGVALLDGTEVKTRGDFIAHILTTHIATHVGQLSAWRRSQGHDPLF